MDEVGVTATAQKVDLTPTSPAVTILKHRRRIPIPRLQKIRPYPLAAGLTIPLPLCTLREPIVLHATLLGWRYVDDRRFTLRIYITARFTMTSDLERREHTGRGRDSDHDVQACSASTPFSLPIPLSFIPPLLVYQ